MKNKRITLLLVAFVMALTVISPLGVVAASKHKGASSGQLKCSSYYYKGNVPNMDVDLYIDSTHHYIGVYKFTSSWNGKVKITYGKSSQTMTFKNFCGESKVNKTFRGKKCTVKLYATNKKTGKASKSVTYKKVKL